MKKYIGLMLFAASFAQAQTVPAIDKTAAIAPLGMDVPKEKITLDAKELAALKIAKEWKNSQDKPTKSADGSVIYVFGVTLPTLVCNPLQVCAIRLQPGEVVNEYFVGDKARWHILPSIIGSGTMQTENMIVKPTESGLVTNLIITTDRRSYTIKLVSAVNKDQWMPSISFRYMDEEDRAWAAHKARQAKAVEATTLSSGDNIADLDFSFKIDGDNPGWRPIRVYASQRQTFVQFPKAGFLGIEAPALVVLGKDGGIFSREKNMKSVNYRPSASGDKFEVDYVLDTGEKIALISGVGSDQTKVTIEYVGGRK